MFWYEDKDKTIVNRNRVLYNEKKRQEILCMNHIGTKRLETDRLILRPFIPEDDAPMFRNWASDPMVTRYLTWSAHTDPSVTSTTIGHWIERYCDPSYYHWAVELKSIDEPIGSISGVRIDEDTGSVEIGYCIGRPWWGQGLVAEAVRALMAFFFERVGVRCIVACHHPDNPNSGRVMQKCGMTYDGAWPKKGEALELNWYSLSREEYANQQRSC